MPCSVAFKFNWRSVSELFGVMFHGVSLGRFHYHARLERKEDVWPRTPSSCLAPAPNATQSRPTPILPRERPEHADGLEQLEANVEGFKIKNLEHDEKFVSAVIEDSRSAISTHKQEKREAIRNAMLNIALHRSAGEDQQQTFLRYIDGIRLSNAPVVRLRLVLHLSDERSGISTEAAEPG
jgi:hypothetical protein